MTDRCRPIKIESVGEGGSSNDAYGGLCEVDIGQDYLDAAGVTLQRPSANTNTADALCRLERLPTGDMQLCDPNAGTMQLRRLLTSISGLPGSHNTVADIIHWLGGGGPGDGFASGAYLAVTTSGIRPTSYTWYASQAAGAAKLFAVALTYQGLVPSTITYTLYQAGSVVRTVVDTLSYASPFYPSCVRTYS